MCFHSYFYDNRPPLWFHCATACREVIYKIVRQRPWISANAMRSREIHTMWRERQPCLFGNFPFYAATELVPLFSTCLQYRGAPQCSRHIKRWSFSNYSVFPNASGMLSVHHSRKAHMGAGTLLMIARFPQLFRGWNDSRVFAIDWWCYCQHDLLIWCPRISSVFCLFR